MNRAFEGASRFLKRLLAGRRPRHFEEQLDRALEAEAFVTLRAGVLHRSLAEYDAAKRASSS